jgi:hypothetical protein
MLSDLGDQDASDVVRPSLRRLTKRLILASRCFVLLCIHPMVQANDAGQWQFENITRYHRWINRVRLQSHVRRRVFANQDTYVQHAMP